MEVVSCVPSQTPPSVKRLFLCFLFVLVCFRELEPHRGFLPEAKAAVDVVPVGFLEGREAQDRQDGPSPGSWVLAQCEFQQPGSQPRVTPDVKMAGTC